MSALYGNIHQTLHQTIMIKKLILGLITVYQKLAPSGVVLASLGGATGCRYFPTCSRYTKLAIEKYGLGRGLIKGVGRILRCHPFAKGGVDQV